MGHGHRFRAGRPRAAWHGWAARHHRYHLWRSGMNALPTTKAQNAYELLSEVCQLITEEPKRYNQRRFIARLDGKNDADNHIRCVDDDPDDFPACNTVG